MQWKYTTAASTIVKTANSHLLGCPIKKGSRGNLFFTIFLDKLTKVTFQEFAPGTVT